MDRCHIIILTNVVNIDVTLTSTEVSNIVEGNNRNDMTTTAQSGYYRSVDSWCEFRKWTPPAAFDRTVEDLLDLPWELLTPLERKALEDATAP